MLALAPVRSPAEFRPFQHPGRVHRVCILSYPGQSRGTGIEGPIMVWISCGGARRPYWSQQIRPLAFWTLGECRLPVPAAFMMWVQRNFRNRPMGQDRPSTSVAKPLPSPHHRCCPLAVGLNERTAVRWRRPAPSELLARPNPCGVPLCHVLRVRRETARPDRTLSSVLAGS